jgi:polar amino acid transport system substrate-binding protein
MAARLVTTLSTIEVPSYFQREEPMLKSIQIAEKTMKILRISLLAAAALLAAAPALADLKIGVAAEPYPPFTAKDASGKWVGWEIDLVDALCAEMKEKCEIVETAWDGIIPALNASKIDVIIASMSKNAKRREVIDFSNTYYTSAAVMMGARNGDLDSSPEHLAGKIIGVQVATIHAAYAEKYYGKSATIQTYQTQDEVNQDLAAGRIDYVLANGTTLDAFLKSPQGGSFETKAAVPLDVEIIGEGAGAGIRKGDTELAGKLNAALSTLAKGGKLDEISAKNGLTGLIITPKE